MLGEEMHIKGAIKFQCIITPRAGKRIYNLESYVVKKNCQNMFLHEVDPKNIITLLTDKIFFCRYNGLIFL